MKNKRLSRIVSLILSVAMVCSLVASGAGVASAAGGTYEKTNLIVDPGFDLPEGFVTDNSFDRWNNWDVSKSNEGRSGSCVKFSKRVSSLQYNVDGSTLQPGVTYVFSIWVRVADGDDILDIGVKDYGGSPVIIQAAGKEWKQYSIEFTYLSGNPILYAYNNNEAPGKGGATAEAYLDDASLMVKGDVERAEISNGAIAVQGDVDMSQFSAVYTSSLNPGVSKVLDLTTEGSTLRFEPIAAAPLEQTVTVILSYKGMNITLSFDVEASDEEAVPVQIDALSVTNGTVVITLKEIPTLAPTASDFKFDLRVDGGKTAFRVSSFDYDNDKTVTVSFEPVSSSLSADREVSLTVSAGETSLSDGFIVAQGTSRTYYVSSSTGNDRNDGLSPESPFQSIDKLNTLTFAPGDRILFKTGDTFEGMFRPKGSGVEGAPIVAASYGGGDAKPILKAIKGETLTRKIGQDGDSIGKLKIPDPSPMKEIGGSILLENVEYWEIRDLELLGVTYDPDSHDVIDLTKYNVMDAGIRVINDNQGDLSHFVFDNLTIHGFRGRGTNLGKTCGGIQFNVIDTGARIPSCFVDASVTNCEIYDCGRSGINSLTAWGYRVTDSAGNSWPSFPSGEYDNKYSYYPSRNFYMADCNIYNIDGDGLIVDTWSNVVVEDNTVYRCAIHLAECRNAAVGLFNWNSNNVVFQYNECYDNGVNATRHMNNGSIRNVISQDGQGIEVDALNEYTWVQYNYLHGNAAFMMICCEVPMYTSFNSYIRYNLCVKDGCNYDNTSNGMGLIMNGGHGINTQIYNNTIIMDDNNVRNGYIHLFKYDSNQYKVYNNIFYYAGSGRPDVYHCTGSWGASRVNGWSNNIDFRSNIFVGFGTNPTQDDASHPNIFLTAEQAEGLFAGGTGADAYRLSADTYDGMGMYLSSMDDGMFSGVDLAGNDVTAPGIGAFQFVR